MTSRSAARGRAARGRGSPRPHRGTRRSWIRTPSAWRATSGRRRTTRSYVCDHRLTSGSTANASVAAARPEVVRVVVHYAAVRDEDVGLAPELELLADLRHEDPQLGLAGGALVDPERVVAHDLAPQLHRAARPLHLRREGEQRRRLADPVGADERDLGGTGPRGDRRVGSGGGTADLRGIGTSVRCPAGRGWRQRPRARNGRRPGGEGPPRGVAREEERSRTSCFTWPGGNSGPGSAGRSTAASGP